MKVTEGTKRAKDICNNYKYLYGGKGEAYTKALVDRLAKQYKSKYTSDLKKEALKDADKGYKAGDCSFLVCAALGLSMINSLAIKQQAVALFKPEKSKALEGMALWKNGHVAYIGDGLKIYELKSTKADGAVSSFEARAKDFTYMFVVKGSPLYELQLHQMAEEISIYYPAYKGNSCSIVTGLITVGEKDYSYAHRKQIAVKNSIADYEGSIAQNTKLLNLLKAGKLKKA